MPIGVMVTLAGRPDVGVPGPAAQRTLPRIRDFQGVSPNSFDGRGNYSLGMREQVIFPEIEYDKIDKIRGMQINDHARPRRRDEEGEAAARAARHAVRHAGDSGDDMARKALYEKTFNKEAEVPGRGTGTAAASAAVPRAYIRKFDLCRICFRQHALLGQSAGREEVELVSHDH